MEPLKHPGTAAGRIQRLAVELAASGNPDPNQPIRIRVAGRSMEPVLAPGDDILVLPVDPATIEVGTIITFLAGSGPVTHRVVGLQPAHFVTKGDNARAFDLPVHHTMLVGAAICREGRGIPRSLAPGRRERLLARVSAAEGSVHRRFETRASRRSGAGKSLFWGVHALFRVTIRVLAGR